jgi:cephalosporin-C deacetylase-like acetyl esterase
MSRRLLLGSGIVAAACWLVLGTTGLTASRAADPTPAVKLAQQLRTLDAKVLPEQRESLQTMVSDDLRKRTRAANLRSTAQWREIDSRRDWQRFRDAKLKLLCDSLGTFPPVPQKLQVRTTGTLAGDGYRIDNLVFESRPGLWVTANLYQPAAPADSMPGIVICHSHHAPKDQGELQGMGMTWARRGCLVLVPDMLGHGERRQHPFVADDDFEREYRVGRQDYYFRYDMGIELHLVGESLMGWFAWDLWRAVDVLLARPGVDPQWIVLLGAVAGGGDPAAVAAALDRRIQAAVPFNFGGPQPETRYPLPEDAERTFNYAGSGSFESTRNLRRSAAEGFLPWVIVGSIAPRRLVYAHEFAWDEKRDPVWKRLQEIWGLHGASDHLAAAHGRGQLRGRPPESSHCTNIGRLHRQGIHPAFERWFDIRVTGDDEYSNRRTREELQCMTPEAARELKPRRLCDLLGALAAKRVAAARARLAGRPLRERRRLLRADWSRVLGRVEPGDEPKVHLVGQRQRLDGAQVERIALEVEPGILVPLILLLPQPTADGLSAGRGTRAATGKAACVVAVSQSGKEAFLRNRSGEIGQLLAGGMAVCLPDVRGTGETNPDGSRQPWSAATAQSSTELMLGGTMVGARLRDLRSVLQYLRGRNEVDAERIALWGDSFAAVNPPGTDFKVPRRVDGRPKLSEPLGGLLALLGGLYEEQLAAVYVRGGLSDFQSVLSSQFVWIPHDVVIPAVLTTGDLPELAAALAPRPLRLDDLVDGKNRGRGAQSARTVYQPAIESYRQADAAQRISIDPPTATSPAAWLLENLRRGSKLH